MSVRVAQSLLAKILESVPSTRPLAPDALHSIVSQTVSNAPSKGSANSWDACLRREIFGTVRRAQGNTLSEAYYEEVFLKLDVALSCTEQDLADQSLPLGILSDLFDMHTIDACERLFEWLDSRAPILTKNMQPSKGKALILLKQLNALVRRVSKTGDTAKFNGRILNFLSGAFPIGERSGVNLRGEYAPSWEEIPDPRLAAKPETPVSVIEAAVPDEMQGVEATAIGIDAPKVEATPPAESADDKKVDFYVTFWSLQTPISSPPTYFQNKKTGDAALETFKSNVNKILSVFAEATKKERLSSSSKGAAQVGSSTTGSKRKREEGGDIVESESMSDGAQQQSGKSDPLRKDYFFAKFLTSFNLLELEVADLHFRRQILIQILILFNYLRTYQTSEKERWTKGPGGRTSLRRMEGFMLEDDDSKWMKETWDKIMEELRAPTATATGPGQTINHRTFQECISDLLDRERAWAKWKNDGCPPFEKGPLPASEFEAAAAKRAKLLKPLPPLEHALGTEDLTEVWENGYHGPQDLEDTPRHTSFERYVKDYKMIANRIKMREKQLNLSRAKEQDVKPSPTQAPAPAAPLKPKALEPSPAPATPPSSTNLSSSPVPTPAGHGLPPKPVDPMGMGNQHPGRPTTPTVPPKEKEVEKEKPVEVKEVPQSQPPPPSKPVKINDSMLEGFIAQREIFVWRGLRAAAQEGIIFQLKQSKDSKDAPVVGDLEVLQAKFQAQVQADAAAAAKPPAPSTPTPAHGTATPAAAMSSQGSATMSSSPIKIEEDARSSMNISAASSMEVDAKPAAPKVGNPV